MAAGVKAGMAGVLILALGSSALFWNETPKPNREPTAPAVASPLAFTNLPVPATGNSPPIRVCLTSKPVSSLKLKIDGAFTLRVMETGPTLKTGSALKESQVECAGQFVKIGSQSFPGTRLEIVPKRSPSVWVNGHQYRGVIRIHRQPDSKLLAVNVLPLEDYLASVVDSEMPAAFPNSARRAQAICSRTYALYQMGQSRSHPYFDVYSSTKSQNYLGYQYLSNGRRLAGESEKGRQIARETKGMVCIHNGKLFCTYYSAVCGGQTTRGDLVFRDAAPPLKSVACNYCEPARLYRWTEKFTNTAATKKLATLFGSSRSLISMMRRIDQDPLTPASLFQVTCGEQHIEISAANLRRKFSLPSAQFQIVQEGNVIRFEGQGHGHGVGFCQWGSRGLALQGKSAMEILQHYYPGSQVKTLPW